MPDFGRWTANGGDPSLNEINRTDRFLDALAAEQPVYSTDSGEAELAHLLAGWRDEVRDAPLTAVLTPRDAAMALDRATASRQRRRLSVAVVGSVAAAVLCLGGFGAVIAGAGPGDPLYGLRTMLFGEQQQTREDPVMLASQQLAEVQQLIDEGQWDAAQDKLQTLTTTVATVNDVEQKQELVTQWQEMTVKVESQDANATPPPGAPLPEFPIVPVPVAPGLDTTTTTTTSSSETTTTSPSDTTTSPTSPTSPSETTTTSPTSPSETTTASPSETATTSPSAPTSSPVQQPPPTTSSIQPPPPSTPLPTPPPTTPLPTPPPSTPLAVTPLPTPSAVTPLPTPTTRVPLPTPTVTPSEVEQEEPATTTVPPILEAPAPKTVVTTTIVLPEPGDEPR